jgi:hypothetical protein
MYNHAVAVTFHVSGLHGALLIIAVILFAIAAVIAWCVSPRTHWATLVAAGLCLAVLSALVT